MNKYEVNTKSGKVRGKEKDGILKWLGIPYAEKPLGNRRFRRAVPVSPWSGVLDATSYAKKPIQGDFLLDLQNKKIEESEDCLYLNIMSSGIQDKKPVLVWIYGGAFIIGEPTTKMYDGTKFVKEGVVFVSINYRLGIYGGFDLSHLDGGNDKFDDNIFISDQVQALKWIHENIEAFGGDPDNITIMGESAGGTSVINLMAVPEAKGLFQKVICESGVIGATVRPKIGNLNMQLMLKHLNIEEKEIEKIKDLTTEELEEASVWLLNNYSRTYPGHYLAGPMTGSLLPELPLTAIKKGSGKGVKLLIGTNQDEATLFVTKKNGNMCSNRKEVEQFLDSIMTTKEIKEALNNLYKDYGSKEGILSFMGDLNFTYHSSLCADYQSQFSDTYMYRYTYVPLFAKMANLGCYHTSEIPFVFNTTEKYEMKQLHSLTTEKTLDYFTYVFHNSWLNFIKYGNPNGKGDSPWPKYNVETKKVYRIDKKCEVLEDPYAEMKKVFSQLRIYQ